MTIFGGLAQPKLLEVKLLTQRETIEARQREKLCIRPVAWDLYEVHASLPSRRGHRLQKGSDLINPNRLYKAVGVPHADTCQTSATKSVQILAPLTVNMQATEICSKDRQRSGRDRELSGTSHARSRSGPKTREWLAAQEILTNIPAGGARRCHHS